MVQSEANGKRTTSNKSKFLRSEAIGDHRPLPKPFRQGSLDAYCGLYAIANAMLRLAPDWFLENDEEVCRLFRKMVNSATKLCTPGELCSEGLDGNELIAVADVAVRHMKKQGLRFKLVQWPYSNALMSQFRVPLLEATARDTASQSVILHIEDGAEYHWSVLKSVQGNRVHLFDSDAMKTARVEHCEPWVIIKMLG